MMNVDISPEELEQICALLSYVPCYYEQDSDSEASCPLYIECGKGHKKLCEGLINKLLGIDDEMTEEEEWQELRNLVNGGAKVWSDKNQ